MLQQYLSHHWHRELSSFAPCPLVQFLTNTNNLLAISLLFGSVRSFHMGTILHFCVFILVGHCYTSPAQGQALWADEDVFFYIYTFIYIYTHTLLYIFIYTSFLIILNIQFSFLITALN